MGPPLNHHNAGPLPPGHMAHHMHGHGAPPPHGHHSGHMPTGPPHPGPGHMHPLSHQMGPHHVPPHPMHPSHAMHHMHGPDGRPPPPPHLMDHHHHHHPGRHTPYHMASPDFRIYEMNKRLQQRSEESDNLWWDSFATEFFEDDATLTLTFCLEDGPKRYAIGRTLIPRYFRSIFDGGVADLSFHLKHAKESFHNATQHITLDCEQCSMITTHGKPSFGKDPMMHKENSVVVCTEGRLIVDFTFDDLMRIRSWHFATRQHLELIPRALVAMQAQQDPTLLEQMGKNITRQGLTTATLNYLRLCVILEPMQELMSRHKVYSLSPRDCLKTTLFHKWQRMVTPPETARPASKRRKRKSSNTNSGPVTGGGGAGKKKNANANNANNNSNSMSPGPANFSLASQDVMVVGEPSLMGGEFGDEDERLITRLENNQYDPSSAGPANGIDESEDFVSLPGGGGGPPVSSAMTSGPWNAGPGTSGSGPPLPPPPSLQQQCSSGSGPPPPPQPPPADNRPGSVPNGSNGQMEDKKPSPNSLNQ